MVTEQEIVPAPPETVERPGPAWRGVALVVVPVLLAGAALGALGGWLWYQWWGPPDKGIILDTVASGPRWVASTQQGIEGQFDGPGEYAVIALGFGVLLGILAAVLGRRQALAALAGLVAASALAAYLAFAVGTALSPPDPQQFANPDTVCTEEPCKEYDAAIETSGWTPFLCWPIGALGAYTAAIMVMSGVGTTRTMLDELEPLPSAKDA